MERQKRRVQERILQTERFIKSMRLLQMNDRSGEISTEDPFEDYTFHLYRQMAPDFEVRCKSLEHKLFYSVSYFRLFLSALEFRNPRCGVINSLKIYLTQHTINFYLT